MNDSPAFDGPAFDTPSFQAPSFGYSEVVGATGNGIVLQVASGLGVALVVTT